ncbi:MAG TPA: PHP domain-containing protein [Draconibacterium sp.]|nr:PHP domain-containing protein [Draconibacterium sp.]
MHSFRADLHIHTVLSPCAELEMTPRKIVGRAVEAGLQIIGITDHNSTLNAEVVKELGSERGILVLMGAEVTTREEVHCLAFFEDTERRKSFQTFLDENSIRIPNPDGHFGYQPVVDADENILEMIPYFLTAALKKGINEISRKVMELGGIFIPAHVNRQMNGLFAQLGFLPPDLHFDALGITGKMISADVRKQYDLKESITLVRNSDAHFLEQIGSSYSIFEMKEARFEEIKLALKQQDSRRVRTE